MQRVILHLVNMVRTNDYSVQLHWQKSSSYFGFMGWSAQLYLKLPVKINTSNLLQLLEGRDIVYHMAATCGKPKTIDMSHSIKHQVSLKTDPVHLKSK